MAANIKTFWDSAKVIKTEPELLRKNAKHTVDSRKFQKFLYENINFLSACSSSESGKTTELEKWFALVSQVLPVLYSRLEEWDQRCLNLHTVITYLNHIGFHLVKIKEIPLDWHKYLAYVVLESLALYSNLPKAEADFIADVAHKSYAIVCTAGQKMEKDFKTGEGGNIHLCYELYLLGAAILSIDRTNKTRNGLKTAKDLLVTFSQSAATGHEKVSPSREKCGETELSLSLSKLLDIAVMGYRMQPRDISSDASLSFYVELFRLVEEDPDLRQKLLACDGNFFKFEIKRDISPFVFDGTQRVMDTSAKDVNESKAQDIVLSVLNLVHMLNNVITEQQLEQRQDGKAPELAKKCKSSSSKTSASLAECLEKKVQQDLNPTITAIEAQLAESSKPLSPAIGDCLMALVHSVPAPKLTPEATLLVCYKLISLSVEVLVRDILHNASKENQFNFVSVRVYTLAVANKARLAVLQVLLLREEADSQKVSDLSAMQKSCLTSLFVLAHNVKRKKLLVPTSNSYRQIFKSLENAMYGLSSMGRHLRRLELHEVAITLFAPLWPITNMEELFPHVSHHETLAESYRLTSQLEKACRIIAEAAKLDTCLLSDTLVKTLVKIVKQDSRLCLMKLFDPCKEDEEKHAQVLTKVVRGLLSCGPSVGVVKPAVSLLQCLVQHKGLSESERAVFTFLFAENVWFDEAASGNVKNNSCHRDPQAFVHDAVLTLSRDTSHHFDDFLAQAAFLYWEILNINSCLDKASTENAAMSPSSDASATAISPFTNATQEPLETEFTAPATPLSHVTTPRTDLTFATPALPRPRKAKNKDGHEGTVESGIQVDSKLLVGKAAECLRVWADWFQSHGCSVISQPDGLFRAEKSLGFLQRIADLAVINHQAVMAMKALCQARNLADLVKKEDVIKRVTSGLVALVPQLGLQCGIPPGNTVNDDVFMSELGLGQDGHVLHLAAVAAHHLKCGEVEKFTQVNVVALKLIEESRERGPLTPNVTIALAVLKRLNAQFLTLRVNMEKDDVDGVSPYPVELAGESLKYISGVAAFYLGEEYKSVENRGSSMDTWRVIHEYLCTLKVVGELFLYTGNVKYARTHFFEGWNMARSCLLTTWSAVFLSKMVEVSLQYHETTKEAQEQLQGALSIIQDHVSLTCETDSPDCDVKAFLDWTAQKPVTDNKLSNMKMKNSQSPSCCTCDALKDATFARQSLLIHERDEAENGLSMAEKDKRCGRGGEEEEEGEVSLSQIVCSIRGCQRCMTPEVATICTSLMWSRAEILSRSQAPFHSLTKTLNAAACSAQSLSQMSFTKEVECIFKDCKLNGSVVPQAININTVYTIETLLRVAETCFHKLYLGDTDKDAVTSHYVESLLKFVVQEGKKLNGFANSDILVASAQLMRIHLRYVDPLKSCVQDDREEEERLMAKAKDTGVEELNQLAVEESASVISSAVSIAKQEMEYWDDLRLSQLNLKNTNSKTKIKTDLSTTELKSNGVKTVQDVGVTGDKKAVLSKPASAILASGKVKPSKSKPIAVFHDHEITPVAKSRKKVTARKDIHRIDLVNGESPLTVNSAVRSNYSKGKSENGGRKGRNKIKSKCGTAETVGDSEAEVSPLSKHLSKLNLGSDLENSSPDQSKESANATAHSRSTKNLKNNSSAASSSSSDSREKTIATDSPAIYLQKHKELMERLSTKKVKPSRSRTDSSNIVSSLQRKERGRGAGRGDRSPATTSNTLAQDLSSSLENALEPLNDKENSDIENCGTKKNVERGKIQGQQRGKKLEKKPVEVEEDKIENKSSHLVTQRPRRGRKAKPSNTDSPESRRGDSLPETPVSGVGNLSHDVIVASPGEDSPSQPIDRVTDISNGLEEQSCKDDFRTTSSLDKFEIKDYKFSTKSYSSAGWDSEERCQVLSEIDVNISEDNDLKLNLTSPIEIPRGRPQRKIAETAKKEANGVQKSARPRRQGRRVLASINTENERSVLESTSPVTEGMDNALKENVSEVEETGGVGCDSETPAQSKMTQSSARKSRLSLKKNKPKTGKTQPASETEDRTMQSQADNQQSSVDNESTGSSGNEIQSNSRSEVNSPRKKNSGTDLSTLSTSSDRKSKRNSGRASEAGGGASPLEAVREKMSSMELDDIENDVLLVEEATPRKVKAVGMMSCMKQNICESDIQTFGQSDFSLSDAELDEINKMDRDTESVPDGTAMKTLIAKFPTLSGFHSGDIANVDCLRQTLERLQHFPHSFLYRQVSRSLALTLWEGQMMAESTGTPTLSTQQEIAAHLTDSMHVTFQHLMTRNLHAKLRKTRDTSSKTSSKSDKQSSASALSEGASDWTSLKGEELQHERRTLGSALKALRFRSDVMEVFTDRLKALPADWTVVQMTVLDFDPMNPGRGQLFVTRLTSDLQPITVGIPCRRWQHFVRALKVYETAIKHNVENVTPEEYWKYRYKRDKDMQNLVLYLQEFFLCGHKWLLRGQLDFVQRPAVQKLLDRAARRAVEAVQKQHQYSVDFGTVRVLMEVLLYANEKDVSSLVECVWPLHVARTVTKLCMEVQREVMRECDSLEEERRGPTVLILDKALNKVPWESMPCLFFDTVTRVPSLASLHALLILHRQKPWSPYLCGVSRTDTVAVVDPETNLQNSTDFLVPQFRQYRGWTCLTQQAPTVTDLRTFLTDHSLYLYCGHGWGKQFVGGDDLQMFRGKAVAVLMGCHSGKLEYRAKLEGDGGPLYFLLAGCPAVMGNLWLVTDKDIDKLTSSLVSQWMSQPQPVPLGQLLATARKVCKLVGLNGFAPVIYGLPVLMNN